MAKCTNVASYTRGGKSVKAHTRCGGKGKSIAGGVIGKLKNLSEKQLGKRLDIVQSQLGIVLKRGNPKTGIRKEDQDAYDRLIKHEASIIKERSKR